MKRLLIAAVLLALTAGLCVWSQCALNDRTDRLLHRLDEVEQDGRLAADFAAGFADEVRPLHLFLPHDAVDAAAESAALLPTLWEHDPPAFAAEVTRCRERLLSLRESEWLTPENLL